MTIPILLGSEYPSVSLTDPDLPALPALSQIPIVPVAIAVIMSIIFIKK